MYEKVKVVLGNCVYLCAYLLVSGDMVNALERKVVARTSLPGLMPSLAPLSP